VRISVSRVLIANPVSLAIAFAGLLAVSTDDRWLAFGAALALIIALFMRRPVIYRVPLDGLAPLFLMLAVAIGATLLGDASSTVAASRGGFYFARIAIFAYAGYVVAKAVKSDFPILIAAATIGVYSAADYVYRFYTDPMVAYYSREDIRNNLGTGSLLVWLVPCLLFLLWRHFRGPIDRLIMLSASALAVAAIVLSTSRSAYLSIAAFALVLWLPTRRMNLVRMAILPILIVLLTVTTPFIAHMMGMPVLIDLTDTPLRELAPPPFDMGRINEQWRGFETWRAFDFVSEEGVRATLWGLGIVAEVPLGLTQTLAGQITQQIPVFHNGFSFAFVRAGLVGLFLYFWLARSLASSMVDHLQKGEEDGVLLTRVGLACLLVLIVGTPTIGGFFNPDEIGAVAFFFIGGALARSQRREVVGAQEWTPDPSGVLVRQTLL
jgi:hypothetical protein